MDIQAYLAVIENIEKLDKSIVEGIFLDLLLKDKVDYHGLTEKYIESLESERKARDGIIVEISNKAMDVIFSSEKERI